MDEWTVGLVAAAAERCNAVQGCQWFGVESVFVLLKCQKATTLN
jgi:hypothetical protein